MENPPRPLASGRVDIQYLAKKPQIPSPWGGVYPSPTPTQESSPFRLVIGFAVNLCATHCGMGGLFVLLLGFSLFLG